MADFTMPSLGADMDSGTLLEWLVKPGDVVAKGDIVAVVDTAKSAVDVETFTAGVVETLLVEPGQEVPVGTVLATIAPAGVPAAVPAAVPASVPAAGPASGPARVEEPALVAPAAPAPAGPPGHVSSPLVRRLAGELGVDLATVEGTGKGGAVTRADVQHAAEAGTTPAPPAPPAPRLPAARTKVPSRGQATRARVSPYARRLAAERGIDLSDVVGSGSHGTVVARDLEKASTATPREPATGRPPEAATRVERPARAGAPRGEEPSAMRVAIARLMSRSKQEIPHYYLSTTIDMGTAMAWLHRRNLAVPVSERLVPAALLLKATALAAAEHPELNGFWVDDRFQPAEAVHLGVAVSLKGGGLVAPALHDATELSLPDLMAGLRDVVKRAKVGRLRRTEMVDPTITVTNLGDQGVESVLGVIYAPQVALVGFGRVLDRPWAVDGLLGVRPVVTATLSADHRATDGFTGGRFLATIDDLLQKPEEL